VSSDLSANLTVAPEESSRLRITEIFHSIQGEGLSVGVPTVFIRLTGCPLRCQYCDTTYAFSGGAWWQFDAILATVKSLNARHITVTGGEPLAQKACTNLLTQLCDLGYAVSLETSGAISIAAVDPRVSRVVDLKTPGSGEVARNLYTNLHSLRGHDQVKLVICDRADYEWAKTKLIDYALPGRCEILFSPSYQQLPLRDLAEWILADHLPVRLQTQLHKVIWGDVPGR
jgi:7-carboxy-7-deazaguanine synthase